MRRAFVSAVVVIVGLLVAGDFGFRAYAERRFSGQVQEGLGTRERPDLDLGGFPFALAMARGKLPSARVEAEGVSNEGLRVERVRIDLRSVTFDAGAVLSGRAETVRAESGSGSATVTAEDLTAYINMQGYPGRISFAADVATVDSSFAGIVVKATGPLSVRDGTLVFEPERVEGGGAAFPVEQVGFSFQLPRPFEGFRYTGIVVGSGSATLAITIRDAVIRLRAT